MQSLSLRETLIIVFSFLAALIFSIIPLPNWLFLFRPSWVPLILIYWAIVLPNRISIGIAWLLGVLLDALYGTLLGEHSLALCIITYLANRFHRQIRMYPLLQQSVFVLFLILIYQLLLFWIQTIIGQSYHTYWFWVPAITSMLFWPWIVSLFHTKNRI